MQSARIAVDHFVAQNKPGYQGAAPSVPIPSLNSPVESWTKGETRWVAVVDPSFGQLTPVPEPSTYGALLLGSAAALVAYRRCRAAKQSAA